MKVHSYERAFLVVSGITLVAAMAALVYATVARGMHLPGDEGRIDPARVYQTAPFDRPGVRQVAPNRYEAVVISQAWIFLPQEIRIPRGAELTIIGTAADVIHGFHIDRTRVNAMMIPGQVTRLTHVFDEPGEHLIICHEYCGIGHHTMAGRLIVE